jgi:hypothetical protein
MSQINVDRIVDASGGVFAPVSSVHKNRIINGAMVIDARNAGAAVTVNSGAVTYNLDRWFAQGTASAGVFTVQQSFVAPTGFTNSSLFTVTTVDSSLAASNLYSFSQNIEGFNVADLGWGTASAKTVTLSFWVRSSVTGTFGGAFGNSAANRSYPFTYTISAANTWEQKSITVAGDTSGTWLTNNGIGLRLYLGVGVGSTFSGTAGAWAGSFFISATGATNLMATSDATFYITGVQLEVGTQATSFEYRQYQQELGLCQRYYEAGQTANPLAYNAAAGANRSPLCFMATKRVNPTIAFSSTSFVNGSSVSASTIRANGFYVAWTTTALGNSGVLTEWTASSEL